MTDTLELVRLLAEAEAQKASMLAEINALKAERDTYQASPDCLVSVLTAMNTEIKARCEAYGLLYWATHPDPEKRARLGPKLDSKLDSKLPVEA